MNQKKKKKRGLLEENRHRHNPRRLVLIYIVVSIVRYAIRIVSFEKSVVSLIRIVGAYESDDTVVCIVRIVRIVRIGCIGRYINN